MVLRHFGLLIAKGKSDGSELQGTFWGIENGLHWVLDIAFREDDARLRKGDGDQNFAILRQLALNLLRQDTSIKLGIKDKRLKAGWDERYLRHILASPI